MTDRDLTVLQALLCFFPETTLDGSAEMIVFPSNKAICERLHGMPCSTMRRHLGRLVEAGLLLRRDSPNGKRYTRRHGAAHVAFGIDLSPLCRCSEEIVRAAEAVRAAEDLVRRLREAVSLMHRDLAALAVFGEGLQPGLGLWDELRDITALTARALRRKLSVDELEQTRRRLECLLDRTRNVIDGPVAAELITSDARIERHFQNSDKDSHVLELVAGTTFTSTAVPTAAPKSVQNIENLQTEQVPKIPLHLVVASCPSLKIYYPSEIRHWHQLFDAACHLRPAVGISVSAWAEAQRLMGREQAAIVVAAILERFAEIRSPGGYLRALTAKAASGTFSCGPMIMALIG